MRAVGSGHSSTPILETEDVLVSLERFQGIVSHDSDAPEATVRAGTTLERLGSSLLELGLDMPNYGDVATQTIARVVGTGTHGTGKDLKNLSALLVGGRLVASTGEIIEFSEDRDPDFLRAARVALGTLGIFTELRLRLVPSYTMTRREWCTGIDQCMEQLEELIDRNRSFDFYWYPRSDQAKLRQLNPPGGGPADVPCIVMVETRSGWAHEVLPKHSTLPFKFDESAPSWVPPSSSAARWRSRGTAGGRKRDWGLGARGPGEDGAPCAAGGQGHVVDRRMAFLDGPVSQATDAVLR